MPSAKKHRKQKATVSTNKKRQWRQLKKKKNKRIPCDQIRESWDSEKTVKQNLAEMGLAIDPNRSVTRPSRLFAPKVIKEEKPAPLKPQVVKKMEVEASLGEKEKRFQLPSEDVHFCTYMLDKYGDSYKAMARDRKNAYQLTPKQIRNKIRGFKRSKQQYEKYLNEKQPKLNNAGTEAMDVSEASMIVS